MDRNIVYPGSIPQDTDILSINRNTMIAIGFLARAVLGKDTVADGLVCQPTSPASLSVIVSAGSLTQLGPIDQLAYGSIPASTASSILKMGIITTPTTLSLSPPPSAGQSVNYLIQACFQEVDTNPVLLPYYNASNPAQSFSGPGNTGSAQNTARVQQVLVQAKAGVPANTGSQTTPPADAASGWVGLYQVSVAYGQTSVTASNVSIVPSAPFLQFRLPGLRPGVASGVQSFASSGSFAVPVGVTQAEVEVWGAGSGSYASVRGLPSGGGSGGGYARKLVTKLTPGQTIPVIVGAGGAGGTTGGVSPAAGGSSSFGPYVSASGGNLNQTASAAAPGSGATPPGGGSGGDVNFFGSAGQAGISNQGGLGGAAPMGGAQNSGLAGNTGIFPGGGAAGAGTGADGSVGYNGGSGAGGLVVVRW